MGSGQELPPPNLECYVNRSHWLQTQDVNSTVLEPRFLNTEPP